MNLSQAVTNEMNIIELEDGLREDKERFYNIAHSSFKSVCDLLQTPDEAESEEVATLLTQRGTKTNVTVQSKKKSPYDEENPENKKIQAEVFPEV